MAKLDVPPTKSQYLEIGHRLTVAREGYDLLEQKRQILVFELMRRVEAARRAERDVEEKLDAAYTALREALLANGSRAMQQEARAVKIEHELTVHLHYVMGIALPAVEWQSEPPGAQFGLTGSVRSDEVALRFQEALGAIAHLAEVENCVVRLARELRRTQRRVNALEKVFIPDYEETADYILRALEEREREGFVIMRMIKQRHEARRRVQAGEGER